MHHTSNSGTAASAGNPVISRFTIAILASILCGVSYGRTVPPDVATMCGLTGLAGFTGFLGLDFAARIRQRRKNQTLKTSAEYRLLAHAVSALMPPAKHHQPPACRCMVPAPAYDGGGWEWREDVATTP